MDLHSWLIVVLCCFVRFSLQSSPLGVGSRLMLFCVCWQQVDCCFVLFCVVLSSVFTFCVGSRVVDMCFNIADRR